MILVDACDSVVQVYFQIIKMHQDTSRHIKTHQDAHSAQLIVTQGEGIGKALFCLLFPGVDQPMLRPDKIQTVPREVDVHTLRPDGMVKSPVNLVGYDNK